MGLFSENAAMPLPSRITDLIESPGHFPLPPSEIPSKTI